MHGFEDPDTGQEHIALTLGDVTIADWVRVMRREFYMGLLLGSFLGTIGFLAAFAGFFIGMTSIFLIDALVPHDYIGQHHHSKGDSQGSLMRVGLLVAFGVGIHNFPEGMATFAGALKDVRLGIAIAVAIAIHNIPEGMAIGVAFGAAAAGIPGASLTGAIALAIGIGIQNFPEGLAISAPLTREGMSKRKSWFYGQLSADHFIA